MAGPRLSTGARRRGPQDRRLERDESRAVAREQPAGRRRPVRDTWGALLRRSLDRNTCWDGRFPDGRRRQACSPTQPRCSKCRSRGRCAARREAGNRGSGQYAAVYWARRIRGACSTDRSNDGKCRSRRNRDAAHSQPRVRRRRGESPMACVPWHTHCTKPRHGRGRGSLPPVPHQSASLRSQFPPGSKCERSSHMA